MRMLPFLAILGLLLAGCTQPTATDVIEGDTPQDPATGGDAAGGESGDATEPGSNGSGPGSDAAPQGNDTASSNDTAASTPNWAPTLYLHKDGDRQWMDETADPKGSISGSNTPTSENTYHRFNLEPSIEADQTFGDAALIKIHWSVQQGVIADMKPAARLIIAGTIYEAIEGENGLEVALPDGVNAGHEIALEVCICGSGSATSNYVIDLDERTWVKFQA